MAKRSAAKPVRLTCPKCLAAVTVVAYIAQGVNKEQYYAERAEQHDCQEHARRMAGHGKTFRNPLKVSKAMAKGR